MPAVPFMIKRFPSPLQMPVALPVAVAPALQIADAYSTDDDHLAWVRWLFQSARLRGGSLTFASAETHRSALLKDWEHYTHQLWLPGMAPVILTAWQAAMEGQDEKLWHSGDHLPERLDAAHLERSVEAGRWLLESTRGAKYQGALGRLRQKIESTGKEPHLPVIWGAVAALFQMPALDMLMAVLAEEWRAGNSACLQHADPQGPLSFSALAAVAMRQASLAPPRLHGQPQ